MYFIYLIKNKANGKVYVGQTSLSVEERWKIHVRDSKRLDYYLYRAIKKYGPESFAVQEIDRCETEAEADALERAYIIIHRSIQQDKGYNITAGGNGVGKASEETRRKMSASKIGNRNSAKQWTAERRAKQAEIALAQWNNKTPKERSTHMASMWKVRVGPWRGKTNPRQSELARTQPREAGKFSKRLAA